jgi:hypothetical protein
LNQGGVLFSQLGKTSSTDYSIRIGNIANNGGVSPFFFTNAGAGLDPHFKGFHGETYDFQGLAGEVFNIYSDVDIQFNALFEAAKHPSLYENKDPTFMTAFGLLLGGEQTVEYHVNPYKLVLKPLVRHLSGGYKLGAGGRLWWEDDVKLCLEYEHYSINVTRNKMLRDADQLYLDFEMSVSKSAYPHGLLGQTLMVQHSKQQRGEGEYGSGVVEGSVEEYRVSGGLLGIETNFKRYEGIHGSQADQLMKRHLEAGRSNFAHAK